MWDHRDVLMIQAESRKLMMLSFLILKLSEDCFLDAC